ncbi:uncharacterized protein LOC111907976 isoform X2 [Lactuca sativa]|uniref:Coiled-coil domain-containing protein 22 homolog n=1 Tax=Lactuca sativa TaxID=4236 RepID=A0A9R1X3T2_LACSA|nr:uncharacterized protein LOC111907976 isoform X2 [Lactuca sativa]KAJ0197454.1 hypothetical protein LSAT_V11C700387590 [Lactuca sativa]
MEESQEILLKSLANAGVAIPREALSVGDLTPEALVSICAHSLRIISSSESFPITLPDSMVDRFKICTDLASSVKDLGYIGDMSFHKFLYPSEEDMYRLIRFLVGKLSESSTTAVLLNTKDNNAKAMINDEKSERSSNDEEQDLHTKFEGVKLRTEEAVSNSIQYPEEDFGAHDLLKAAVEMACDEQHIDSHITQLNEQIDARKNNLAKLESKWKAIIKPLEDKKRNLEEALCANQPESQDLESILFETKQREEEISKVSREVEKVAKLATRRSYIERIKEITKNSRKQEIDIERILKETRELQLESNIIQERLHRTYAVVDETLLREAKKDQVGEEAHILVTGIHESFEEISEKILATDRARREMTDLETKLSSIASRTLNIDKLQADLDALRKENNYLQSLCISPSLQ